MKIAFRGGPLLLLLVLTLAVPRGLSRPVPAAQAAPHDPFHALLARSRDLGSVPAAQRVTFLALLRDPASRLRDAELTALYDPRSRSFGRYGTSDVRVSQPTPLLRSARAFLRQAGINTTWTPGSGWMFVSGPARAVERVFRVSVHGYVALSGRSYYAAGRDPIVPAGLRAVLAGTGHISSYPDRRTSIIPVAGLRPSDLLTAYDITPLRDRGLTGGGVTVSFIEIDGFHQSDLNLFTQHFSLPTMKPVIAAGHALPKVQGEAELDLELVHEIAPGADLKVYNCGVVCTNNQMLQIENQAVRDNPRGIISISLGGCESQEGSSQVSAEADIFRQADALGESVFAASGDSGAYTCLNQDWGAAPSPKYIGASAPASEPGLTAVGGTSLSLHASSAWLREDAWQNAPETAGTGGGISSYFARPGWQRGPGVVNAYNTGNRREVPDVAADADPLTGAQAVITGQLTAVGGTSQATPIWAGITALIDQYLRRGGHPVAGFLNPAVYSLAASRPVYPALHDVTVGNNLVYPATPGYDLATGLGTPDAWNLARDLAAYESGK